MKTENIYNQRLLKFANHLSKIKNHPERYLFQTVIVVAFEDNVRIPYEVRYHYWVTEELPVCFFEEWGWAKNGAPVLENSNPGEGTVASIIDFFNLSLTEFSHLFDIDGFQMVAQFGGEKLTEESDGFDISNNIIELVKRRI